MTKTTTPVLSSMFCALALTAGCDLVHSDDAEFRLGYNCPRWQCGYNTSEINGKSLRDLNLDGLANDAGISLVGFTAPLGLLGYELDVDGDELVANGWLLPTLRGASLIGAILWVEVDGEPALPVTIAAYEEVDSWATGSPAVPAYALVYDELDGLNVLTKSVCKGTLVDPLTASVVVLAGERYDPDTKAVITGQDGWLTLGCAGSATAKMALLGYGPNGDLGGQGSPASVNQRQATLNMITANYCGDGHSYTQDGTALWWTNAGGSVVSSTQPGAVEAVWTEAGAICLDTPRLVDPAQVACTIPSCAGLSVQDGEWMTQTVAIQ